MSFPYWSEYGGPMPDRPFLLTHPDCKFNLRRALHRSVSKSHFSQVEPELKQRNKKLKPQKQKQRDMISPSLAIELAQGNTPNALLEKVRKIRSFKS